MVDTGSHLLELSRYVVLNPVRAGMVNDAGDWQWSCYLATVGQKPTLSWLQTDWLLRQIGQERAQAIGSYIDFVRAGVGLTSVWGDLQHQIYLGDDEFVRKLQRQIYLESVGNREIPKSQRRAATKPLDYYVDNDTDAGLGMYEAYKTGDLTMQPIANAFGVHYATLSRALKRCKMLESKTCPSFPPKHNTIDMNFIRLLRLFAIFGSLLLSACQAPQPKVDSNQAMLDGDIVIMEGRGGLAGKQGTLSLMGMVPMSFEELTDCANRIIDSNRRQKQLNAANQQLVTQKAELDRVVKVLDAERSLVDVHSAKHVDAYNQRVVENRHHISQFNANVQTYNAKANELNGAINLFNTACANRAYRRSDYSRLSATLRLSIESKSEATDIPLIEGAGADDSVKP